MRRSTWPGPTHSSHTVPHTPLTCSSTRPWPAPGELPTISRTGAAGREHAGGAGKAVGVPKLGQGVIHDVCAAYVRGQSKDSSRRNWSSQCIDFPCTMQDGVACPEHALLCKATALTSVRWRRGRVPGLCAGAPAGACPGPALHHRLEHLRGYGTHTVRSHRGPALGEAWCAGPGQDGHLLPSAHSRITGKPAMLMQRGHTISQAHTRCGGASAYVSYDHVAPGKTWGPPGCDSPPAAAA